MSCVLRAGGSEFDVEEFLSRSPFQPDATFRKGEPKGRTTPTLEAPKSQVSGFNLTISEASFSEPQVQIEDAIAFLEYNDTELIRLVSFQGVEQVSLDFGIEEREVMYQSDRFPPKLLLLAGTIGIWLELTLYPREVKRLAETNDHGIVIASGSIISPPLHDGSALGLIISRDRRIFIPTRDVRGRLYCLVLVGVERFRGDDIRQGNIILDLTAETGSAVDSADVAYAFDLLNNSDNERFWLILWPGSIQKS